MLVESLSVLELVVGGSLKDLMADVNITTRMALPMCRDVASGMRHLHVCGFSQCVVLIDTPQSENVLHCDLSTRNLLVCNFRPSVTLCAECTRSFLNQIMNTLSK